jgi:hypothetical protein
MKPSMITGHSSNRWTRTLRTLSLAAAASSVLIGVAATLGAQAKSAVALIGVIALPGNPLVSVDIAWLDPGSKRLYLADRSNFGVDIIDAEQHLFVGRVVGMAGVLPSGGGTIFSNGPGPNGVLVTPDDKRLWAGDGNSIVQVADVDPNSSGYLKIIGSVSTAIPACDAESAHYCGRADELGYDPRDRLILVANNAPLSTAGAHALIAPYATFISANAPYKVLGRVSFKDAGGLEQPLWDPASGRFLITVPGKIVSGQVVSQASVAVINPTTMMVENTYTFDCQKLAGVTSAAANGIALGASQHLLVAACGKPMLLDAGSLMRPGTPITPIVINQVGGGDEVWHNPGDDRFYVTGPDTSTPPVQSLGVIDAKTNTWLQNLPDPGGRQVVALPATNHILTPVVVTAAVVKDPSTDKTTCSLFGLKGTGCIAVFTHPEEARAPNRSN